MRILLDESLPRELRTRLAGHDVETVVSCGWSGVKNGRLLALAATRFDVFLTADQNLEFQQNLSALPLAILVLVARSNRIESLDPLVPNCSRPSTGLFHAAYGGSVVKQRPSPACAFCGSTTDPLTKEHIIPAGFVRSGGIRENFFAKARKFFTGDATVKDVCRPCNSGPLSSLAAGGASFTPTLGPAANGPQPQSSAVPEYSGGTARVALGDVRFGGI